MDIFLRKLSLYNLKTSPFSWLSRIFFKTVNIKRKSQKFFYNLEKYLAQSTYLGFDLETALHAEIQYLSFLLYNYSLPFSEVSNFGETDNILVGFRNFKNVYNVPREIPFLWKDSKPRI